ncbi:SIMPL domain-containing protein [Vibrio sp. HB161653]|uniref:SIMPL domain-containing protein n=1 Tax=Vibrio sp. HB236076 TaxID=3232307 RepID=A0AB39HDL6_9VIBR|nr:SIMPL domain-containing protein [Vibrio sp. HB161653]MDP5253934.1 SIMPL domain-containing protein [Vibrio sp. HB161653]
MLLFLIVFVTSSVSWPSFSQDVPFPHLSINGYGLIKVAPDSAHFRVRVVESTMNAEQAKQAVDNSVNTVTRALMKAGMSRADISSSNLSVTPQYHYPKSGEAELVGYRATRIMTVEVAEVDKLDQYLNVALSNGMNQVDNVQLKVKRESEFRQQARMLAIEDAKNQAEVLAKGFGYRLGGVWEINYQQPRNLQPIVQRQSTARSSAAQFNDPTISITDQVSVVFKLEAPH